MLACLLNFGVIREESLFSLLSFFVWFRFRYSVFVLFLFCFCLFFQIFEHLIVQKDHFTTSTRRAAKF